MKKENKKIKKSTFFLIYSIVYCGLLFLYVPSIIFYFNQKKGESQIKFITKETIKITYYHNIFNKEIKLEYKVFNLKKREKLRSKIKHSILYSAYSTDMVSIVDIDKKPHPFKIIILLYTLIPYLLHKNYSKWE